MKTLSCFQLLFARPVTLGTFLAAFSIMTARSQPVVRGAGAATAGGGKSVAGTYANVSTLGQPAAFAQAASYQNAGGFQSINLRPTETPSPPDAPAILNGFAATPLGGATLATDGLTVQVASSEAGSTGGVSFGLGEAPGAVLNVVWSPGAVFAGTDQRVRQAVEPQGVKVEAPVARSGTAQGIIAILIGFNQAGEGTTHSMQFSSTLPAASSTPWTLRFYGLDGKAILTRPFPDGLVLTYNGDKATQKVGHSLGFAVDQDLDQPDMAMILRPWFVPANGLTMMLPGADQVSGVNAVVATFVARLPGRIEYPNLTIRTSGGLRNFTISNLAILDAGYQFQGGCSRADCSTAFRSRRNGEGFQHVVSRVANASGPLVLKTRFMDYTDDSLLGMSGLSQMAFKEAWAEFIGHNLVSEPGPDLDVAELKLDRPGSSLQMVYQHNQTDLEFLRVSGPAPGSTDPRLGIKWELAELDAIKNGILIETIEVQHDGVTVCSVAADASTFAIDLKADPKPVHRLQPGLRPGIITNLVTHTIGFAEQTIFYLPDGKTCTGDEITFKRRAGTLDERLASARIEVAIPELPQLQAAVVAVTILAPASPPPFLPAGVVEWEINPNETVPVGNTNRFNPNQPHVVMVSDGAPRREQLVVFLPGSGGVPKTFERFLGHAASLGFHAIGLAYPSDGSVASACGLTTNGDCYQRIREDIIYKNPKNPEVDEFNSIINRLELLLQHLTLTQPSNHWDRFYTPAGGVAWNKIIPAGHSQGAGHAGLIAKQNECARVAMFAGGDWWPVYCRPAPWNLLPSVTPPERWFSFTHYLDGGEFVPDSTQVPVWQAFGQTQLGDVVNVDVEPAPYRHSHTLVSQLTPPAGVDPHNYTVNDSVTPLDANGRPLYAPAWTHLLTGAEVAPTPPNLVADSIKDFSDTQGSNNWTYGYWNRTANPGSFVLTPLLMFGPTRYSVPAWIAAVSTPVAVTNVMDHLAICDANRTNHTLTAIWNTGCELSVIDPSTGAAEQHLPVRRWTSTVSGPVRIEGNLAMFDTGGGAGAGDGVEGIVRVNGTQVWSGTVNADDAIGITYGIETNLVAGQFVEFVLAPRSTNGEHDAARFTARIYDDCGAAMAGGGEDDLRLSIQRYENGGAELSFEGRRGVAHSVKALAALGAAQTGDALITEIGFPALRERRRQTLQFTVDHPIFSVEEAEVAAADNQAMPSQGFFLVSPEVLHTDPPPVQPGRHELTLHHECRQRRYLLFIPASYNPVQPTPLMLVFHGGGQTATQFAAMHPDLIAEANANGAILVLPQATVFTHPSSGGGMVSETHWFGDDPDPGQTDYVDDVNFTLTLIQQLETGLNINSKRIYAAGFSNGAKFCQYLAGRTKGWFAAFAPVAGYIGSRPPIPGAQMEYVPPPTEPMPIMMVNGGQDTSVPYNGGASASGTVRSSVAEAVKQWITANHCASPAVVAITGAAPSQVITETYATCDPGTEVVLQSVQNMPHIWPDAGDMNAGAPVGFDANQAVIAFCLSHARP